MNTRPFFYRSFAFTDCFYWLLLLLAGFGGFVSFESQLWFGNLMDSLYFNYSTNLDSDFGDLLSGGLNSTQLLSSFNTPRLGFLEFTTHSSDTIMDNNNRYVKIFLYFLVNLTQNLKVSYRFWKIKIFCFIDSTI